MKCYVWVNVAVLLSLWLMVRNQCMHGLLKDCYRVCCQCPSFVDFVVVNWFPRPTHPDGFVCDESNEGLLLIT